MSIWSDGWILNAIFPQSRLATSIALRYPAAARSTVRPQYKSALFSTQLPSGNTLARLSADVHAIENRLPRPCCRYGAPWCSGHRERRRARQPRPAVAVGAAVYRFAAVDRRRPDLGAKVLARPLRQGRVHLERPHGDSAGGAS